MAAWLVGDEMDRIWKEAVFSYWRTVLPSAGKQGKPRKRGMISAIWRNSTQKQVCRVTTLLALCTLCVFVCYGGKYTLGRCVCVWVWNSATSSDRRNKIYSVATAALNVRISARHWKSCFKIGSRRRTRCTHTSHLCWTLFKVTPSRLVTHCGKASLVNVSFSPHNHI